MIGLYPRYSAKDFFEYYQKDYLSRIWRNEGGVDVVTQPLRRALLVPVKGALTVQPDWQGLDAAGFEAALKPIMSRPEPRKGSMRHPLCALGLTFSPCKSLSVAALAGPVIDADLIALHEEAVDFVIENIPPFLVTRKKEFLPLPVLALRFLHPCSRADDPQVHTHLELLWDYEGAEGGALYTTPLFFFQFSLRCLYHYELVSLLRRAGYGVQVDPARTLRWELEGVAPAACAKFSKRAAAVEDAAEQMDFDSLGAAMRFASLRSREQFPATPDGFCLADARSGWLTEGCVPVRAEPLKAAPLANVNLSAAFIPSAAASFFTLQARVLASCLGQSDPGKLALRRINNMLSQAVVDGELLLGPNGTCCHRDNFLAEQEIIRLVRDGVGKGHPCRISGVRKGDRVRAEASAAARPDRIRIITPGRALPEMAVFEPAIAGSTKPLEYVSFPSWDPHQVLRFLKNNPNEDVMLAISGPVHAGEFPCFIRTVASVIAAAS